MLLRPMVFRGRPGLLGTTATVYAIEDQKRRQRAAAQQHAAQQAVAAQQASDRPGTDMVGQLKRLADMKVAGVLTDDEFAAAKAKLLGT